MKSNNKYQNFLVRFRRTAAVFLITFFIALSFTRCGVKKTIPEGNHLLRKNTVIIHGDKAIKSGIITAQILHRTNKRVLFNRLPVFLWSYALATSYHHPEKNDSVAWRYKLRNQWGEPPVLLNDNLCNLSANNIKNYLFNVGYFDAEVNFITYKSNRKAKVEYHVYTKKPYRLNSFFIEPQDSTVKPLLDTILVSNNLYRLWWPLNLSELTSAKEVLSTELRDRGFYEVSPALFHWEIDTLNVEKQGAVHLKMRTPKPPSPLKRYKFGQVHVKIICSPIYLQNSFPTEARLPGHWYQMNHFPLQKNTLRNVIQIDSGTWYSQSRTNRTYTGLVEMGLFDYVDIQQQVDTATLSIQTFVTVKANSRMFFNLEPQALYSPQGSSGTNFQTQSQRSFGMAGILSFNNNNLWGHAENLKISSITSWEAIFKRGEFNNFNFAQGIQQGFNAQLSLPNFQLLSKIDAKNNFERRNTVFSLSYQFENNPNFMRSSLPASVSFQFIRPKFSWYYTPIELSYNKNILNPNFLPRLPELDQDFVKRVFTNQLISAAKLGMVYANDRKKPGTNYFFLRMGLEASGNLHRAYRYLFEPNFQTDSSYRLFGVNYFQYTKIESEIRFRRNIDELNTIAFRAKMGLAIPYGNSNIIPYDKRYFIGGSNSLRGWRPRGLGPGAMPVSNSSIIDRSGELIYEANLEYRFTLIKQFIESALFLDAGNIWNFSSAASSNPNYGVINRKTFIGEVAVNTGIGMRFDLDFFMFRVDWGWPLRDPSKSLDNRWVLTRGLQTGMGKYIVNETTVVIGIDYPF